MTSTEAPFSFTRKTPTDLITVRGNDFGEFTTNLSLVIGDDGVNALVAQLSVAAPAADPFPAALQAAAPIANPVQPVGWGGPPPPANVPVAQPAAGGWGPPVAAGPPPGEVPLCPGHNQPAKFVQGGISKTTGKPYSGFYACAAPDRDQQCKMPFKR